MNIKNITTKLVGFFIVSISLHTASFAMNLHRAAEDNNIEAVLQLIGDGADINARAAHQCTPLHIAAKNGRVDVVRLLLEHRATVDAQTIDQKTPLHLAEQNGHVDVVRLIENWPYYMAYIKRAGRSLPLASPQQRLSLAMSHHPRLGCKSPLRRLPSLCLELIGHYIVEDSLDEIRQIADSERAAQEQIEE